LAKEMSEKTLDELAVDMYTREDALPHLMAKAEVTRRLTVAQLDAAKATIETANFTKQNAQYMLASVIVALLSALAAATSAYFAYLTTLPRGN
jgi:hypothetical protein